MNKISVWLVALVSCLGCLSVHAAQLTAGDAVPPISAKDQHGTNFTLTTNVQYLLVVTEKSAAKSANQKLVEQGAGYLEKHRAMYLMDIHTMPTVGRWFAFPKLKKYPHRIILVDSADALAKFPTQPGCVTVVKLTPVGRVERIRYWNPTKEPASVCFEQKP